MNKRSTIIIAVIIILSALPFTLNIIINLYFEHLDTEIYETKKSRIEQRRQIEKMFPELKDADKLTVNEE